MARRFKSGDLVRFHHPNGTRSGPSSASSWDVAVVIDRVGDAFFSRKAPVEYYILYKGAQKAVWDGYLNLLQTIKAGVKSDSRG